MAGDKRYWRTLVQLLQCTVTSTHLNASHTPERRQFWWAAVLPWAPLPHWCYTTLPVHVPTSVTASDSTQYEAATHTHTSMQIRTIYHSCIWKVSTLLSRPTHIVVISELRPLQPVIRLILTAINSTTHYWNSTKYTCMNKLCWKHCHVLLPPTSPRKCWKPAHMTSKKWSVSGTPLQTITLFACNFH